MSHITSIFIHQDLISTEEAKEIDLVHYDNEVCVEPTTKLCELQSHRFRRHQLSEKGGRLLRIQLLSSQPSLQLSTRDLVSMGLNAYSVRRQSYLEPSLFTLIRQCREWKRASAGVSSPKAYSRQDEILRGMAKLKSGKMGNVGVNMPWWDMMAYGPVFFLLAKFRQKANFFTSGLFLAKFGPKKNIIVAKNSSILTIFHPFEHIFIHF
jgi:hypothetical protein